jgi:HEAT repeat protein
VAAALLRAPSAPITPLAQIVGAASAQVEDRARAARLLGLLDDEQAAGTLLAAVGQGPPPVRAAVVEALAHAPRLTAEAVMGAVAGIVSAQEVRTTSEGAETSAREADLVRLLPPAAQRFPERRGEVLATLRAALAAERPFEVRARAVMALGALGAAGDPAALVDLRTRADDPVLRYLATRELAAGGGADVAPALRAALTDQDPRVRETAALGLGKQKDASAGNLLISAAKQEPWPFVRRAELEALGHLCGPGTGDLLIRAVQKDVDEVRRAALVSLARCKDPRARITLLRTLARAKESATLRELSAALLGESGDVSATRLLAEALRRLVVESEADLALEGVAAAALRALAHLGGPDALDAAITLSADTRHPFRASAIEALAVLCDPERGAATLRTFVSGPDPQLAVVAQNAERHCAKQAARQAPPPVSPAP